MINLSRVPVFVTPQMFSAFSMFVTNDLTAVLGTYMGIFMIYAHTKFNMPSPDGALVIFFKPKRITFSQGRHVVILHSTKFTLTTCILFEELLTYIIISGSETKWR
jgi:hypothetical protein